VVAFSPDGSKLASLGDEAGLRLWDLAANREMLAVPGEGHEVYSISFSPDGKRVALAGTEKKVRVYDSGTGKQVLALAGDNLRSGSPPK
jgi:WD40 repeat protein